MEARTRMVNNATSIGGIIANGPVFHHEILGEKFYDATLAVPRLSGYVDMVPVVITDRVTDIDSLHEGDAVSIDGSYRSMSRHENDSGKKRIMYVFAEKVRKEDDGENENRMFICGFVCREPAFRITPRGIKVTELNLAVARRANRKNDYAPCVLWGRNAMFASRLQVGSEVSVTGRFQSKKLKNEDRMYYEISVDSIQLISGVEKNEEELQEN